MESVDILKVESNQQKTLVKSMIENHHSYVASNSSVGRRIDWLIYYNGDCVGMIGIGSSVYPPPKDLLTYLGVSKDEYRNIFNTISNNWRFCLTTTIPNLGTRVLKLLRNDAPLEWKNKYGDTLTHLMTFVGAQKSGSVYKADNWDMIGWTSGLNPNKKSVSMKWNNSEYLSKNFVKPEGGIYKKMIFVKSIDIKKSKTRESFGPLSNWI